MNVADLYLYRVWWDDVNSRYVVAKSVSDAEEKFVSFFRGANVRTRQVVKIEAADQYPVIV